MTDTNKALRKQLVSMLKGGEAHAKFEDVISDSTCEVAGHEAGRLLAFSVDAARTSPHHTVGHLRVQPQCETQIAEMARRILAEDRRSSQCPSMG